MKYFLTSSNIFVRLYFSIFSRSCSSVKAPLKFCSILWMPVLSFCTDLSPERCRMYSYSCGTMYSFVGGKDFSIGNHLLFSGYRLLDFHSLAYFEGFSEKIWNFCLISPGFCITKRPPVFAAGWYNYIATTCLTQLLQYSYYSVDAVLLKCLPVFWQLRGCRSGWF